MLFSECKESPLSYFKYRTLLRINRFISFFRLNGASALQQLDQSLGFSLLVCRRLLMGGRRNLCPLNHSKIHFDIDLLDANMRFYNLIVLGLCYSTASAFVPLQRQAPQSVLFSQLDDSVLKSSTANKTDEWISKELNDAVSPLSSCVVGPKQAIVFDTTLRDGTQGDRIWLIVCTFSSLYC